MVAASAIGSGDNAAWDAALKARNDLVAESLGDRLTVVAHAFGLSEVYLGDDGLVYISGKES